MMAKFRDIQVDGGESFHLKHGGIFKAIQLIRSSLSVFSFEHVCLYPHINISIQYPTVREDNAIDRLIINKTRFQFLDLHEILEIIVNIGFQFSLVVLSCLRVSVSRRR